MKFVPYEKQQKKLKKEQDRKRRRSFGTISPVTRRPEKPGVYKRKKTRERYDDNLHGNFFFKKKTSGASV